MIDTITTKEEFNKAIPIIKIEPDKPTTECGNEEACELKEELLDGDTTLLSANRVFELAFKNCDKDAIIVSKERQKILKRIVEEANKGLFEVEIENASALLYKPFKYLLEDNGYEVYLYDKYTEKMKGYNTLTAQISWDREKL